MDLVICEICGATFETNGIEICHSCRSHKSVKKQTTKKEVNLNLALKRVLNNQVSKQLKIRKTPCAIEKLVEYAENDDKNKHTRLDDIEVKGVKVIVYFIKNLNKKMFIFNDNGQSIQGYTI